jgi:hypothetical protein
MGYRKHSSQFTAAIPLASFYLPASARFPVTRASNNNATRGDLGSLTLPLDLTDSSVQDGTS